MNMNKALVHVPTAMIGPAKRAISLLDAYGVDGLIKSVKLPKGIRYQGRKRMTVAEIFDTLDLWDILRTERLP